MGAFLSSPNTRKVTHDGQIVVAAPPALLATDASAPAPAPPPAGWLVRFGGASMQAWRKYQEDRISFMRLEGGRQPRSNLSASARSHQGRSRGSSLQPTPQGIHMLFLSVFDGHGGADTSHYAHTHFHTFLRERVEGRMTQWMEEKNRAARGESTGQAETVARAASKKRASSSAAAAAAGTASASTGTSAAAPPPYPLDSAFLTQVFLDFDASIPLPAAEDIPRNAAPPPPLPGGLARSRPSQNQQPPEGNNIPHLASGTTASLCIIDLANQVLLMAHIGDSRIVVFNSVSMDAAAAGSAAAPSSFPAAAPAASSASEFKSSSRMSPVEEEKTKSKGGGSRKKKKKRSRAKSEDEDEDEDDEESTAVIPSSVAAAAAASAAGSSDVAPSTSFSLQYASRDHHPDDAVERSRLLARHYESTFLNWQPPSNSRICHLLQRISLNVVRGFGDAWFKLEESAEQAEQMVCAVPDCWAVRFPAARGGSAEPTSKAMIAAGEGTEGEQKTSAAVASSSAAAPTTARPPSPADSRCSTPVLPQAPLVGGASGFVVPPAGESLFVILASDGIWNAEFPEHTRGVSIAHGASTAKHSAAQMEMFPPDLKSDIATRAAAKAELRSQGEKVATEQAEARAAMRSPRSRVPDDLDEEGVENAQSDEESEGGFDSGSDSEGDYSDMAVNLAVAQYLYNQAQPILEQVVHGAPGAAAAAGMLVHAPPRAAPSRALTQTLRRSSSGSSATARLGPAAASSSAAAAAAAPVPESYSSVVGDCLDLLMAQAPLTKANLKATDNMSAWLISITPLNAEQMEAISVRGEDPVLEDGDELSGSPTPLLTSQQSDAAALALDTKFTPSRHGGGGANAAANSNSLPSPSTPATPRFFNQMTPPLVHQNSLPTLPKGADADAESDAPPPGTVPASARSMSVPGGAAAHAPAFQPPKMKQNIAARAGAVQPRPTGRAPGPSSFAPIPPSPPQTTAPSAAAAAAPSSGHRGRSNSGAGPLVRSQSDASNAPTPFLDDDEEDELSYSDAAMLTQEDRQSTPSPLPSAAPAAAPVAAAAAATPSRDSSTGSKKRRRSNASDASPASSLSQLPPQHPPARVPSRSDMVQDLLFSNQSILSQLSPPPPQPSAVAAESASSTAVAAATPVDVSPAATPRKQSAKSRKLAKAKANEAAAAAAAGAAAPDSESAANLMIDVPAADPATEPTAAAPADPPQSDEPPSKKSRQSKGSNKKSKASTTPASAPKKDHSRKRESALEATLRSSSPSPAAAGGTAGSSSSSRRSRKSLGLTVLPSDESAGSITAAVAVPASPAAATGPAKKGRNRRASMPTPQTAEVPDPAAAVSMAAPPAPASTSGRKGRARGVSPVPPSSAPTVPASSEDPSASSSSSSIQLAPTPPAVTVLKSGQLLSPNAKQQSHPQSQPTNGAMPQPSPQRGGQGARSKTKSPARNKRAKKDKS